MVAPVIRVLVVEDDPASRSFLEIALAKLGYHVVGAQDVAEAEEQLNAATAGSFSCVLTDYRMPDRSGLELLAWIKEQDPSLATILVTAQGDKHLVVESLRGGAVDFLDKPVDLEKLRSAVELAVERTSRHRHLAESESAVKELGRAQRQMLAADALANTGSVDLYSYPKHEAGGDFFSSFRPAADRQFYLLTDVSGHNLQAAYISAYFQGFVRGLLARGTRVEEIFPDFNQFLLTEWDATDSRRRSDPGYGTSVAACALLFDFSSQVATVFTHGTPTPVYSLPLGESDLVGGTGGFPLGWFPDLSAHKASCSIAQGGFFSLWTDGLQDLAESEGVSALSLAFALQQAREKQQKPPWIDSARDDILLAVIHLSTPGAATERFRPLICEQYHGGQTADIDELQASWQRSLTFAVPELPEGRLHDILLASREAVLNALQHGCLERADRCASFQAAYCSGARTFSIRVSDPGAGHHFDLTAHERVAADQLRDGHRGLILVQHLAREVRFEREGAAIIMNL